MSVIKNNTQVVQKYFCSGVSFIPLSKDGSFPPVTDFNRNRTYRLDCPLIMQGCYSMLHTVVHIQDPVISVRVLHLIHNN